MAQLALDKSDRVQKLESCVPSCHNIIDSSRHNLYNQNIIPSNNLMFSLTEVTQNEELVFFM